MHSVHADNCAAFAAAADALLHASAQGPGPGHGGGTSLPLPLASPALSLPLPPPPPPPSAEALSAAAHTALSRTVFVVLTATGPVYPRLLPPSGPVRQGVEVRVTGGSAPTES